jgi:hypothetical protein
VERSAVIEAKVIDTPPTDGRGESPRKQLAQHRSGGYEHGLVHGNFLEKLLREDPRKRINGLHRIRPDGGGENTAIHYTRLWPFSLQPASRKMADR